MTKNPEAFWEIISYKPSANLCYAFLSLFVAAAIYVVYGEKFISTFTATSTFITIMSYTSLPLGHVIVFAICLYSLFIFNIPFFTTSALFLHSIWIFCFNTIISCQRFLFNTRFTFISESIFGIIPSVKVGIFQFILTNRANFHKIPLYRIIL